MGVLITKTQRCSNPSGRGWPGILLPAPGACCSSVYFHKGDVPVVRQALFPHTARLCGGRKVIAKSQIRYKKGKNLASESHIEKGKTVPVSGKEKGKDKSLSKRDFN